MNIEEIKKEITLNGGVTLQKNLKKAIFKNGYIVSNYGTETTLKLDNIDKLNDILKEYQKIVKNDEYIGIWSDKGILYIDISKEYGTLREAVKIGKKNKQIAIFDTFNDDAVYLKNEVVVYTLYNSNYKTVTQLDTLKDINKYLNTNYKMDTLKVMISKGQLFKDLYYIKKDILYI